MKAGVTGHQSLGAMDTVAWLRQRLTGLLGKYQFERGYTCLAAGADQLFASVLRANGVPFVAILPCRQYDRAFSSEDDVRCFRELLAEAADTIELPFDAPSEQAFYEAGKKVVDCADTLIAVWNGEPARGLGGTADIVSYAELTGRSIIHLNPITQTVSAR